MVVVDRVAVAAFLLLATLVAVLEVAVACWTLRFPPLNSGQPRAILSPHQRLAVLLRPELHLVDTARKETSQPSRPGAAPQH